LPLFPFSTSYFFSRWQHAQLSRRVARKENVQ